MADPAQAVPVAKAGNSSVIAAEGPDHTPDFYRQTTGSGGRRRPDGGHAGRTGERARRGGDRRGSPGRHGALVPHLGRN
jgi:hypothetical protein